jgi:hypothetical protein
MPQVLFEFDKNTLKVLDNILEISYAEGGSRAERAEALPECLTWFEARRR